MKASGNTPHCSATVLVANLPFSFTSTLLEETFSEVGPVRRCFMVTKKGSSVHRGFGFFQFATVEDSYRAIELKNGSTNGGRKIGVKHAMHRAPLEKRRAKENRVHMEDFVETKNDKNVPATSEEKLEKAPNSQVEGKSKKKRKRTVISSSLPDQRSGTEKQRVAKTVIFGGLLYANVAEEVHCQAWNCGTVCSVTYPLPKGAPASWASSRRM